MAPTMAGGVSSANVEEAAGAVERGTATCKENKVDKVFEKSSAADDRGKDGQGGKIEAFIREGEGQEGGGERHKMQKQRAFSCWSQARSCFCST